MNKVDICRSVPEDVEKKSSQRNSWQPNRQALANSENQLQDKQQIVQKDLDSKAAGTSGRSSRNQNGYLERATTTPSDALQTMIYEMKSGLENSGKQPNTESSRARGELPSSRGKLKTKLSKDEVHSSASITRQESSLVREDSSVSSKFYSSIMGESSSSFDKEDSPKKHYVSSVNPFGKGGNANIGETKKSTDNLDLSAPAMSMSTTKKAIVRKRASTEASEKKESPEITSGVSTKSKAAIPKSVLVTDAVSSLSSQTQNLRIIKITSGNGSSRSLNSKYSLESFESFKSKETLELKSKDSFDVKLKEARSIDSLSKTVKPKQLSKMGSEISATEVSIGREKPRKRSSLNEDDPQVEGNMQDQLRSFKLKKNLPVEPALVPEMNFNLDNCPF